MDITSKYTPEDTLPLQALLKQTLAMAPDKPWTRSKGLPSYADLYNKQRVYEQYETIVRNFDNPLERFMQFVERMRERAAEEKPKKKTKKSASPVDYYLGSRTTGPPVVSSATVSGPSKPKVSNVSVDTRNKTHGGEGRKTGIRRIGWCFTLKAICQDKNDEEAINKEAEWLIGQMIDHCEKYAFQLESAPTTGYLHFQGYFELNNKNRFEWIQKHITKFEFLQERKGTPKQAWTYCTKQETQIYGPWTLGEPTVNDSGNAKVLEQFVRAIESGATNEKLWEDFPSCMVRYPRTPSMRKFDTKPIRTEELKVYVLYGPPGTGKSRTAVEKYPDIYKVPFSKTGLWMTQDAAGVKQVLLEDFNGELPLKYFNRILDRYPEKVEIKGGHVWWCPDLILITTNILPSLWYPMDDRQDVLGQIYRRITGCYDFTGVEMDKRDALVPITVQELVARYPSKVSTKKRKTSPMEEYFQYKMAILRGKQPMMGLMQQPANHPPHKKFKPTVAPKMGILAGVQNDAQQQHLEQGWMDLEPTQEDVVTLMSLDQ